MDNAKCKKCRRAGDKLFLRGDRCLSQKCALIRRNSAPGPQGKKKKFGGLSEYGKQLKEKQKLKFWYGLREKQFKNYFKEALSKRKQLEDIDLHLGQKLESRLDNIIFRFGFASSRIQARELLNHGHFFLNGKRCNIPSIQTKKGDVVCVKPISFKKKYFQNLLPLIKKYQVPSWLELDKEKLEGKILRMPQLEEINLPVELSIILEFYSR